MKLGWGYLGETVTKWSISWGQIQSYMQVFYRAVWIYQNLIQNKNSKTISGTCADFISFECCSLFSFYVFRKFP